MRRRWIVALALLPFVLAAVAIGGFLFVRQGGLAPYLVPRGGERAAAHDPDLVARGEYLARLGDCASCHTPRGGVPYAGGRAIDTGYGTVYSTNLTPDAATGIGDWSLEEFAHAMRHGVSRDGILYPAFPYAQFAHLADEDIVALFAYLRSLPAHSASPPPNRFEFPASPRAMLIGWRMLYYRPESVSAPASTPLERGRYLVDGLGHCAMCHSARGPVGSLPEAGYLAGGRIEGVGWYAPPLDSVRLQRYSAEELARYLRTGTSAHGTAYGPMAEVIYNSLQFLDEGDASAMAAYLKSLPPRAMRPRNDPAREVAQQDGTIDGAKLYERACADCHGKDGEGGHDGGHPPLRDASSVAAPDPVNAVRLVLYGAMAPATRGNPRPYTMPPFVQQLSSAEIAAVVDEVRRRWGGQPSRLTASDVEAMHGIVLD